MLWKSGGRRVCIFETQLYVSLLLCLGGSGCVLGTVSLYSSVSLSLSLPNYTDVPNADSSGTSYSSNIHTTSRRVNV